jgi:hypothetical protein
MEVKRPMKERMSGQVWNQNKYRIARQCFKDLLAEAAAVYLPLNSSKLH